MRIAILGFGREGRSILKFLARQPRYHVTEIWILDKNTKLNTPRNSHFKISHRLGKNYLKNLDKFDIVFRSPGVPYNLPQIQKALKRGVKFSSASKLFFENSPTKNIIGVTGTKGKGTTCTLLYEILKNCLPAEAVAKAGGADVMLAGNIGKSPLEILPKLKSDTWVVLELSSFQLQDLEQSLKIAAVLDIFPDHLDSHKNFKEYIEAKTNIGRFQTKQDKIFYFADNKNSAWIANQSPAQKIPVEPGAVNLPPLKIPGAHNRKNAAMAKTVALSLDCPEHAVDRIIADYKGMEHRLEFVRRIKPHSNVLENVRINFYNDSASTNPQTAAAAVLAFSNTLNAKPYPLVLIAGGKDKNLDYKPLSQAIKKSGNVQAVILFGENKRKIKKALVNSKRELGIYVTDNLKSAINTAFKQAKSLITSYCPLVIVIFSPGSASFDMFKDYQDRGEKFKKIVKSLKK